MSKVISVRFTWSPRRITASTMAFLWLVSTWAAAANWCCESSPGSNQFAGEAVHAQHELADHGILQDGHDHAGKIPEEPQNQPANPDCAEIALVDKCLRLAEVAFTLPSAEEIDDTLPLTPWPIEIPRSSVFGQWVLPPPPIYQANPFLSTIRLLL